MATAEFSKFAGILSAALSQHHLSGFEIAQLLPCLFNLYAEYIVRNTGLNEAQAGIKISGRNNNNLRYTDDTTVMAENTEELKSLLMKMTE